jgi:uncharacterized protein YndB with AHSA1/START domain
MLEEPRGLTLEPDRSSRHAAGILASPAEVYRALTDPRALSLWFVSEASIDLRPGGSYRWVFGEATGRAGGDAQVEAGEFTAVAPQELVRMRARVRDLDTDLEFRLEPWGDGTILTISHAGFPGEAAWDEVFTAVDQGWASEIQILKFHLEKARGMRRRSDYHEARIGAPPEEVFDRFTTQSGLCSWLADGAAADPCLGGEYCLEWAGRPTVRGRYVVWDPDRFLVLTWEGAGPSVVRIWLEEEGDGAATGVSLEHRLFAPDEDSFPAFDWGDALDRLGVAVRPPEV